MFVSVSKMWGSKPLANPPGPSSNMFTVATWSKYRFANVGENLGYYEFPSSPESFFPWNNSHQTLTSEFNAASSSPAHFTDLTKNISSSLSNIPLHPSCFLPGGGCIPTWNGR